MMNTTIQPQMLPPSCVALSQGIHQMGLTDQQRLVLEPLVSAVLEDTTRRRKILQVVQESIEQVRLDMKYLCFDIEATRRERDDYKGRLGL